MTRRSVVEKYNGVAKNAGEALGEARDYRRQKTIPRPIKISNVTTGSLKEEAARGFDPVQRTRRWTIASLGQGATKTSQKTVANTREISATLRAKVVSGNSCKLDAIVKGLKATSDKLRQRASN